MPLHWSSDMGDWPDLNGRPMVTPAMKPMNLELLWSGAEPDGENVDLYGVDGTLEREWFEIEAVHAVLMQLVGDVDHAGNPTASIGAGMFANYRAVVADLKKSTWGGPSCSTTVTAPDGTQLAGQVQPKVGTLGPADGGGIAMFVVTVTIPTGELVEVTP